MGVPKQIKTICKSIYNGITEKAKYSTKYIVEGNIKNHRNLLYILSGYKPYLWNDVFSRVKAFQLDDMDVCIASSGVYSSELSEICKKNNWVYLSTKKNNVCILSNIVMREFPMAENIFKMDEDIYIPNRYFERMLEAYNIIETETHYSIGYVLPYQPLGVYAMREFLVEHNYLDEFEKKFGKLIIGGTYVNPVLRQDVGVDAFIWECIGNFDRCANEYAEKPFSYEPCVTRPCIAAILFKRNFWKQMNGFKPTLGNGVGDNGDEGQMTSFSALCYKPAFCIKNIMVGHFSFGGAEQSVLELKENKPEIFMPQK